MKVELRNVKYAKLASEETACFNATVVIDDRPSGAVRNDGRGGANFYDPRDLEDQLEAYAKTLPPLPPDPKMGIIEPLAMSADLFVGELLHRELGRKDLRRLLKGRVVTIKDGKVYQTAVLPKAELTARLAKPSADVVLNLLPEDEALDLFLKAAG
jgi:hypothetical protein